MNTIATATETLNGALIAATPQLIAEEFVKSATTRETENEVARLLEELKNVQERHVSAEERISKLRTEVRTMRDAVRNAFLEEISSASDTATFDLEEANNLLEKIGADKMKFTWTSTVTSTVTITGIEASDREQAERLAYDAVSFTFHLDGLGDDAEIENEEQDTSDTEPDDN